MKKDLAIGTSIVWFRNDLRLHDNPALYHATRHGAPLLPIYILDPAEAIGAASRCHLHHSLHALDAALQQRGSRLYLYAGDAQTVLTQLIQDNSVEGVYLNRRYTPQQQQQDQAIELSLKKRAVAYHRFEANLLNPPEAILNKQGNPYKVFTPYSKAVLAMGLDSRQLSLNETLNAATPNNKLISPLSLDARKLLPKPNWDRDFYTHVSIGEAAALKRLDRFIEHDLRDYPEQRDIPAVDGTSGLAANLHFGEISPQTIVHRLQGIQHPARDGFLRQLIWRDFAHAVLHYFPHTVDAPFNSKFKDFPWQQDSVALQAWQRGETGIPIVDAGMRQLWHSGTMHNRVRMIVASLLTKNLLIHWQEGAAWFWDTLLDADLAQNSMNWQWVAGCGVDAAP